VKSVSDLGEAEPSLRLSLDARPESIALLRRQLGGWLEETGATRGELFEIQLATTEAFANAVLHPEEPTSDLVEIAGTVTNRHVTLSVRDHGRWQDESSPKDGGGLGLAIMDELMDSVVIEPFAGGDGRDHAAPARKQLAPVEGRVGEGRRGESAGRPFLIVLPADRAPSSSLATPRSVAPLTSPNVLERRPPERVRTVRPSLGPRVFAGVLGSRRKARA